MMQVALRTQRMWWIVPLVTVCAVIAGGALYIEYVMSGFGACKTVVRSSMPSPNGDKSLVIFGKECGTAVGFNTQASIAPTGGSFSPEKNPAFFIASGEQTIMARWLGDGAVEIIGLIPGGGKVYKREQSVGDIKIAYP